MRTLVVIVALAASAFALAQDDKAVQEAIRGLGSENFEEREKATTDLKKIGAPAVEALKKASQEHADPEVRARAKRIVDEIEAPARRKSLYVQPAPGALPGARLTIRQAGGHTVYVVKPVDGDSIEIRRGPDDKFKLIHPDGKGGQAETESESIEKFLADHKDLAEKYGITKDGIEYGGSKLSFSSPLPTVPWFRQLEVPVPPRPDNFFGRDEEVLKAFEELRRSMEEMPRWRRFGALGYERPVAGATLSPVPDVLRTQLSLPEGRGVVVESVREGSTAAAAGLKRHDVILEIDGAVVAGPAEVRTLLKRGSALKVLRAGREEALQAPPPKAKEY